MCVDMRTRLICLFRYIAVGWDVQELKVLNVKISNGKISNVKIVFFSCQLLGEKLWELKISKWPCQLLFEMCGSWRSRMLRSRWSFFVRWSYAKSREVLCEKWWSWRSGMLRSRMICCLVIKCEVSWGVVWGILIFVANMSCSSSLCLSLFFVSVVFTPWLSPWLLSVHRVFGPVQTIWGTFY